MIDFSSIFNFLIPEGNVISILRNGKEIWKLPDTSSSEQTWDYEWHYSQGLVESDGTMNKYVEGSATSTMTSSGQLLAAANGGYIRLRNSTETVTSGIVELTFEVVQFNTQSSTGLRLMLSNGVGGIQVFVNNGTLRIGLGNNSLDTITKIELNHEYTLRLEFNRDGVNYVYLDNEQVYKTTELSTYYCLANNIFCQDAGSFYIKSLKYKYSIKGVDSFIKDGLSLLLNYKTVKNGDTTWKDSINGTIFKFKDGDTSNFVSDKGVIFSTAKGSNGMKASCDSAPIDFAQGYTLEFCYRECSIDNLEMIRFVNTSKTNRANTPILAYSKSKGFSVNTWSDMYVNHVTDAYSDATVTYSISSAGDTRLYVNGKLVSEGLIQPPTACDTLSIGGWWNLNTPTEVLNGKVSFVRLYDRVLSDYEVYKNYIIDTYILENNIIEEELYILDGLSVLLDYKTVTNGDSIWYDKISNIPFTFMDIDKNNLVSDRGVNFKASQAYSDGTPIDFSKGFTFEICYRDATNQGTLTRWAMTGTQTNVNAPNFSHYSGGYRIATISKQLIDKTSFLRNATIAFSISASGEGKIYVNGVQTASGTVAQPTTCEGFTIGGWQFEVDTEKALNGKVAIVRLYNRILTAEEIKNNYDIDKTTVKETITSGSTSFDVVYDDYSQLTFDIGMSIDSASNTFSKYTPMVGRANPMNQILSVTAGQKIYLNQVLDGITLYYTLVCLDAYGNCSSTDGDFKADRWLSESKTFPANTKYTTINFKKGDGSVDFTAEEAALLYKAFTIK